MRKIISILLLTVVLTLALTSCGIHVPRPEIKKEEFDFSVTYEINGETKTVSGVLVCEYDGTSWSLDGGYNRSWKGTITGVESGIGYETKIGTTEDGGEIIIAYGFNPSYFSELFRHATGESFSARLSKLKIRYAKTLLSQGFSVTDSCYRSGFGSTNNFLYTFKKLEGISPSEYKKRLAH